MERQIRLINGPPRCPTGVLLEALRVKVVIGYSDAVLSGLKRHELDLSFVASQPRDEDLRGQLFLHDRLIAVMSPRHHLAGRDVEKTKDSTKQQLALQ